MFPEFAFLLHWYLCCLCLSGFFRPVHFFAHTRLFIKAVLTHYSSKASIFALVNNSLN